MKLLFSNKLKMKLLFSNKLTGNVQKLLRNVFSTTTFQPAEILNEPKVNRKRRMKSWQINSYGDLNELQFFDNVTIPPIKCSTDVLVKVHSSGVNPIDVAMINGYGSNLLNLLRCSKSDIEFPITLGREFCGVIQQKGMGLTNNLKIGDYVWGVVPVHKNGCHGEYVVVPEYCLGKKPKNLDMSKASGVLYAGLTAWSGIFLSGNLGGIMGMVTPSGGGSGKRVLVLGAAGGVGSTAVQILRAENCTVIATCATDAVPLVNQLGANHVIDYTDQTKINELAQSGPYDLILDCAGQGPKYAEQFGWIFKNYVTFSSPLLKNFDESGLGLGILKNIMNLVESNARTITTKQGCIKWGYFIPAPQGIEYLKNLVERNKLLPLIDSSYDFMKTMNAYEKINAGHLRGKVIINMKT